MQVEPGESVNRSINIDSSVGRDTEFSFSYTGSNLDLGVAVVSPNGVVYPAFDLSGRNSDASKQVTIVIPNDAEVN